MCPLKCTCDNWDQRSINIAVAATCGVLFSAGWWLLVDAHATHPAVFAQHGEFYIPGIFATVALFIINLIPMTYPYDMMVSRGRRMVVIMILFMALVMAFGSMIGAAYIFVIDLVKLKSTSKWPSVAVFLQNLMILLSNGLLKFCTKPYDL